MDDEINPLDDDAQEDQPLGEEQTLPAEEEDTLGIYPAYQPPEEVSIEPDEEVQAANPFQEGLNEDESTPRPAEEIDWIVPSSEVQIMQENIDPSPDETGPVYPTVVSESQGEGALEPAAGVEWDNLFQEDQFLDESTPQPAQEVELIIPSREDQLQEESPTGLEEEAEVAVPPEDDLEQEESSPGPAGEIATNVPLPGDEPAAEGELEASGETVTFTTSEQIREEAGKKKIALVLSGGGARGAFQVGAEMYARQAKGYHWDIIAGVSVGALNGAMLAMHRYQRLLEIWNRISNAQVYTGGFTLPSVIKLLFGAKSFYGNTPLQALMKQELAAGKVIDDLHVGVVSLLTGEYLQFTKDFLELQQALLASTSIPVIWPPVDISPEYQAMVDGGVRNISPVGDVLELEPDEIVIINCNPEHPLVLEKAPDNVLSIGMRALDIMLNEIFVNDVRQFLHVNALVQEAEKQGVVLHHPRTGRALKYYPCTVIEPDIELGDTLDFSQHTVQTALKTGVRRAREVLGKP